MGKLDEIGGPAYLTRLINNTPTAVHCEIYVQLVRRCSHRRELAELADEIVILANDESQAIEKIDKAIHTRWYDISTARQDDQMYTQHDLISEYFDIIEARRDSDGEIRGLPTGYTDVDKVLRGMRREDLIIVAGRTSMGKTALATNIVANVAGMEQRVVFFSLEMGREPLVERMIAAETGIDSQRLGTKGLGEHEWARFVEATGRLNKQRITWDMTAGITPMQMRTKLHRIANRERA